MYLFEKIKNSKIFTLENYNNKNIRNYLFLNYYTRIRKLIYSKIGLSNNCCFSLICFFFDYFKKY